VESTLRDEVGSAIEKAVALRLRISQEKAFAQLIACIKAAFLPSEDSNNENLSNPSISYPSESTNAASNYLNLHEVKSGLERQAGVD